MNKYLILRHTLRSRRPPTGIEIEVLFYFWEVPQVTIFKLSLEISINRASGVGTIKIADLFTLTPLSFLLGSIGYANKLLQTLGIFIDFTSFQVTLIDSGWDGPRGYNTTTTTTDM